MTHQEHLDKGHEFIGWHRSYSSEWGWLEARPLYLTRSWWAGKLILAESYAVAAMKEETLQKSMADYLTPPPPKHINAVTGFIPANG